MILSPKKILAVLIAFLLSVMLFGVNAFCAEAAGDPVLHYKFDGDFTDSSGGFDGTKKGDITFADDGVLGNCAVFNNGYLDVDKGSSFNLGKTFTISAWIKIDPGANQGTHHSTILSKLNEKGYTVCHPYALRTISLRMNLWLKNPTDTHAAEVPVVSKGNNLALDTKWSHVVFADDGETLYLYVDGTLNSTKILTTGKDREVWASTGKLFIGFDGDINGGDGFFLGKMDDLRVYNYALSDDEIKVLYNNKGAQTAPAATTGTSNPGTTVPGTTAQASGSQGTGTPVATSGPVTIITTNDNSIKVTQYVSVKVNGQPLQSDVRPFVNGDGRTMLPIRAIAEALGATVQWDEAIQTATLTLGDRAVKVTIGQNSILVNGQPFPMDTAAAMKDGRTLLPVRAVSEAMGAQVGWDPQKETVTIDSDSQGNQSATPAASSQATQQTTPPSQTTQPANSNNITTETNDVLPLIGSWSTYGPTGSMVDPVTGFSSGSYYSGEWYYFRADGTCRYIILGKGSIISGMSVVDSKYKVEGKQIIFTERTESWTPDPTHSGQEPAHENKPIADETQEFTYNSADDKLSISISTFHRMNE